jgi:P63C domain
MAHDKLEEAIDKLWESVAAMRELLQARDKLEEAIDKLWESVAANRPQVVAKYTDDLVYPRLAPGILDELKRKNPKNEKGYRKARHHQWLTESIGHPALAQHIFAAIAFMRAADDWADFKRRLDGALPKQGNNNMQFAFMADHSSRG